MSLRKPDEDHEMIWMLVVVEDKESEAEIEFFETQEHAELEAEQDIAGGSKEVYVCRVVKQKG